MLKSFTFVLHGLRVNGFGSRRCAVSVDVVRLQRLGKRCGCRLRPKTAQGEHPQLMPPSYFGVRLNILTGRG